MTREELEDLSDDELRELAQERGKEHKNGKRSFTSRARTASGTEERTSADFIVVRIA